MLQGGDGDHGVIDGDRQLKLWARGTGPQPDDGVHGGGRERLFSFMGVYEYRHLF